MGIGSGGFEIHDSLCANLRSLWSRPQSLCACPRRLCARDDWLCGRPRSLCAFHEWLSACRRRLCACLDSSREAHDSRLRQHRSATPPLRTSFAARSRRSIRRCRSRHRQAHGVAPHRNPHRVHAACVTASLILVAARHLIFNPVDEEAMCVLELCAATAKRSTIHLLFTFTSNPLIRRHPRLETLRRIAQCFLVRREPARARPAHRGSEL